MKFCPCFLHFHLIWIQFCTTIYWLILSSMKTDKINTILYIGHKWFSMCSFYIDCVIRVKFGVRDLQSMLLSICECHENLCRKAIHFYAHNWNYIYVCTMKACGIIKVENCARTLCYRMEETVCSLLTFIWRISDSQTAIWCCCDWNP